uniref:MFS domain-containing protein n=1 Tax=Steinernema glaseri TaxID=37863 RepID=A0A1I7ZTC4_9BILA
MASTADATLESAKAKANLWCKSSQRLRIALILALALGIEGLLRSNINMAMVCMVNKTALIEASASDAFRSATAQLASDSFVLNVTAPPSAVPKLEGAKDPQCAQAEETGEQARVYNGDLPWTSREQAMIFTSFYVGGLAVIIPGGLLCEKYGARFVVFWGAVINAVGTVMTPSVAYLLGPYAVMVLRFIMGCGQGILVPCMNVLISCWFPAAEKSTALAISTTGNQFSVIIALFLTAELCQITALGGWAMSFYFYGIFGFVFCALWQCTVTDHPESARVSPDELSYIHGENLHHVMPSAKGGKGKAKPMPWKKILSSPVIWAVALSSFSQAFVTVGIVTYIPQYYKNVLKMKLSSNGVMSALPFVVQLLTKLLFATIADILNKRKICKMTTVTKAFNLIASFGCGICLLLLTRVDCTQSWLAIVLVVTGVGLTSGYIPGYNTSIVCVAPIYTSGIASFCKLLAQIASVASPYMIGSLTKNGQLWEWNLVFYLIAGVLFSTGLFFQISGSSEVQPWAKVEGATGVKQRQEAPLLPNDGTVA